MPATSATCAFIKSQRTAVCPFGHKHFKTSKVLSWASVHAIAQEFQETVGRARNDRIDGHSPVAAVEPEPKKDAADPNIAAKERHCLSVPRRLEVAA